MIKLQDGKMVVFEGEMPTYHSYQWLLISKKLFSTLQIIPCNQIPPLPLHSSKKCRGRSILHVHALMWYIGHIVKSIPAGVHTFPC